MSNPPQLPEDIVNTVARALQEDIGDGDKTAALLSAEDGRASITAREPAILCGAGWVDEVFRQIDSQVEIEWLLHDGAQMQANEIICRLNGPVTALLTGERTALNFMQTLSAVATQTKRYVDAVQDSHTKILDTRKTIPGLRTAQKYAVACGGGINHRMGLYDAILIKENHIAAAGSIKKAIGNARDQYPNVSVEVEVETLQELEQALDAEPDRILLDNFGLEELKQAVTLNSGCRQLEASGNISLENVAAIAATGVDYISIGALTKNIEAIDLSMRLES